MENSLTEDEFTKELQRIKSGHQKELNKFCREFALSRNTVKVGDVVSDIVNSIIVDKLSWCTSHNYNSDLPQCVYVGRVLTKKLSPRKDGEKSRIYQERVLSVNGIKVGEKR